MGVPELPKNLRNAVLKRLTIQPDEQKTGEVESDVVFLDPKTGKTYPSMKQKKRTSPRDNRDTRQAAQPTDTFLIIPREVQVAPIHFDFKDWPKCNKAIIRAIKNLRKDAANTGTIAVELERLAGLSEEDSADGRWARETLARITESLVDRLSILTQRNPQLWRGIPETRPCWPVLMSRHPMHRARVESLMKQLKVGSDTILRADEKVRWNMDQNPFTYVAHQLLIHVVGASAKQLSPSKKHRHLTGWRRDAIQLCTYSRENWRDWWAVAEQAFLEAYPRPEEIPLLADPISKRPSQMHRVPSRIMNELKKSFRQLTNVEGIEAKHRKELAAMFAETDELRKSLAKDIEEALPRMTKPAERKKWQKLYQRLTATAPPARPK